MLLIKKEKERVNIGILTRPAATNKEALIGLSKYRIAVVKTKMKVICNSRRGNGCLKKSLGGYEGLNSP